MPDRMALPAEILASILLDIYGDGPRQPDLLRASDENERIKSLHACCLVNRDWRAQSTPVLYSKFQHKGDENSFAKLWHFLRTIVEKPELGALVKHLDLRERYSWTVERKEEVSPHEQRSRRRERRALLAIGVNLELKRLAEALHSQARAPFMAILTACLPNVSKLDLSVDYFGHGHNDHYFALPFLEALEESKALQQLSEATLFDSHVTSDEESIRCYPAVFMSGIETLFLRPSIRKLELFDLNPCCMHAVSDQLPLGKSNVAHLTITCGGDTRLLSSDNRGLKACLQLPKALVSLTLYMQSFMSMGGDGRLNYMISHDELQRILCHHNHTLEYLDLYDNDATCKQHRPEFNRKALMGKLNEFDRLTTLRIQPEMVLGGINGILKAPYRLRDALPPLLHSLTLYNFYDNKGLINGKDLQTELFQIITDTIIFDNLNFLIIQDTYRNILRNAAWGEELLDRLNALQQACSDRDIIFRIMSDDHLPQGGCNLLKHLEAHEPEERAHNAWKRGLDGLRGDTPERVRYEFVLPPGVDLVTL